ncbi:MAG: hypothetical protein C0614_13630 [Desulfuromonas sp.]|nr:MAG: hypothetical protein C0614_13630 [Desulfuromonas sp.]
MVLRTRLTLKRLGSWEAAMNGVTRKFLLLLSAVVFMATLFSCGGGDGSSQLGIVSDGTVTVSLTDRQALYENVVLTIKEVGVMVEGEPLTYYNSGQLGEFPVTVDILDFPDENVLTLADIEISLPDQGEDICFDRLRLRLASEGDPACTEPYCNYVVLQEDPEPFVLDPPRGQNMEASILIPQGLCLSQSDSFAHVVIDFDPEKAIVFQGPNGQGQGQKQASFSLKPNGLRVIQGRFNGKPNDFISGKIVVPSPYNSVSMQCAPYDEVPQFTVTGQSIDTPDLEPVITASETEGPFSREEVCLEVCDDEENCHSECTNSLFEECYYTGHFKLLLPEEGSYDVTATWEDLSSTEPCVLSGERGLMMVLED